MADAKTAAQAEALSITVNLSPALQEALKFAGPKLRSLIAREINKGLTEGRREIVEMLMVKTQLKRKVFNDRIIISRASPDNLAGRLTPIFGKRVYMSMYPFEETTSRGRAVVRSTSPLYRKIMRTGFMSKDKTRMYLRIGNDPKANNKAGSVRAIWGRSVPMLFDTFGIKDTYQEKIAALVLERANSAITL